MKAIKKIIEAIRSIDGRRLAKATGIVLGFAIIIATICILGKYTPALLLTLAFFLAVAVLYGMLG